MTWQLDKVPRIHVRMRNVLGYRAPFSDNFPGLCFTENSRVAVSWIRGALQAREIVIERCPPYKRAGIKSEEALPHEIIGALVEHPEMTWLALTGWIADLSWAWPLYHELTTLVVSHVYDLTALLQPLAHPGCRIVTLDIGKCKLTTLPHMDTPNYIQHNTSLRTLVVRNSDSDVSDHILNSVACNETLDELVFVHTLVNMATAWCCLKESSVLIFGVDACMECDPMGMYEEDISEVRRWCERARWAIGAWPDGLCENIFREDAVRHLCEYEYKCVPDPRKKRGILRYLRHKRLADMPRLPARVATLLRALYECAGKILPDHVIKDIADEIVTL